MPGTPRARLSANGPASRRPPGAGGIGVFHWEPTWYAVPGNGWDPADINNSGDGWDNMATFNWTGHVNPNIKWTP
ncbi:glycosyl hydrolase 53 family protein [Streptomyces sp. TLI_185]|uniref:glycosyl hydrolase 53 family protein n=1 Tax=Streptomyces sp. TLI_185 TaxID=2485151 RepID=UPI0026D1A4F5